MDSGQAAVLSYCALQMCSGDPDVVDLRSFTRDELTLPAKEIVDRLIEQVEAASDDTRTARLVRTDESVGCLYFEVLVTVRVTTLTEYTAKTVVFRLTPEANGLMLVRDESSDWRETKAEVLHKVYLAATRMKADEEIDQSVRERLSAALPDVSDFDVQRAKSIALMLRDVDLQRILEETFPSQP